MLRGAVFLSLAVATAFLSACGGKTSSAERTKLVAAFYPLAWAAEEVGDGSVEVVNLTPPGSEPHDVELSPRDIEQIRAADLVLYVDGGFQPAVEDGVAGREGRSLDLLGSQQDPHVWLDPVRFAAIAEQIGRELGQPEAAGALARKLQRLDREYRRGLRECARRTLVTTHAAFGRLAARYGLEQLALAGRSPEAEPSPRELERLIEQVRDSGATTVFKEPLVSSRLADTVAHETGVKVAVLDPVEGLSSEKLDAGDDYVSVMRENLEALEIALGCT